MAVPMEIDPRVELQGRFRIDECTFDARGQGSIAADTLVRYLDAQESPYQSHPLVEGEAAPGGIVRKCQFLAASSLHWGGNGVQLHNTEGVWLESNLLYGLADDQICSSAGRSGDDSGRHRWVVNNEVYASEGTVGCHNRFSDGRFHRNLVVRMPDTFGCWMGDNRLHCSWQKKRLDNIAYTDNTTVDLSSTRVLPTVVTVSVEPFVLGAPTSLKLSYRITRGGPDQTGDLEIVFPPGIYSAALVAERLESVFYGFPSVEARRLSFSGVGPFVDPPKRTLPSRATIKPPPGGSPDCGCCQVKVEILDLDPSGPVEPAYIYQHDPSNPLNLSAGLTCGYKRYGMTDCHQLTAQSHYYDAPVSLVGAGGTWKVSETSVPPDVWSEAWANEATAEFWGAWVSGNQLYFSSEDPAVDKARIAGVTYAFENAYICEKCGHDLKQEEQNNRTVHVCTNPTTNPNTGKKACSGADDPYDEPPFQVRMQLRAGKALPIDSWNNVCLPLTAGAVLPDESVVFQTL